MQSEEINLLLVRKYNQPVPRYTSYPTVPYWEDHLDPERWKTGFKARFDSVNHTEGISLYIHLPFCESLCTYCGCNKKITTNHAVEEEYLEAIETEWLLYRKLMKQTPVIRELHLGGGTPTFFSPKNLEKLLAILLKNSIVHPRHEFSLEGHPNNTTELHLKTLYRLGFRRISYGVQDNDPEVQRLINRIQPFENLVKATADARECGFTSVNYDLIYGLPGQTTESIEHTIRQVISLRPDRIAFYSYAHVPWTSRGQRLFDESHLPAPETKLKLYLLGKQLLLEAGYSDIGMDHFALPTDALYQAWQDGSLNRNFMGYTTQGKGVLLGLGVSAISDLGNAFGQNEKALHDYYQQVRSGKLAIRKGYFLDAQDEAFRQYILDCACRGEVRFRPQDLPVLEQYSFPVLEELSKDGLLHWDRTGMKLTPTGHSFIRNACAAFDLHLKGQKLGERVFSKAI